MSVSIHEIKSALTSCDFPLLFLELLGWTSLQRDAPQMIQDYRFQPLTHKAHLEVYLHTFTGDILPDRVLKQLHRELDHYAEEHLTIFVDKRQEHQAWIWTRKAHGEPLRSHVNWWHKPQSDERLTLKLLEQAEHCLEVESPTIFMLTSSSLAYHP